VAKLFGEIDLSNRARVLLKKRFKNFYQETSLSQIQTQSLTASLTDSSIMDRIYVLPKLSSKQIKIAIQQKIKKDLEFIADISEVDWIYSVFPEGNSYRILASIIKKEKIAPLPQFKALTTTSQVLSNFLHNKVKTDFLLVHSFYNDYLVFVFRNGHVDYIRGFTTESAITDSIELTLEYYKEQHKVEIKTIVYSGDITELQQPGRKVIPLNEFIKEKIPSLKFLIPAILPSTKAPFFYERKLLKPIHATIPISIILLAASAGIHYKATEIKNDLSKLHFLKSSLEENIQIKQQKLSKLTEKEKKIQNFLKKPEINLLLSAKKPEIYNFIESMKKPLKKTNSYFLTINGNGKSFILSTITFCHYLEKPQEFHDLIAALKENNYITYFKLLNAEKLKNIKAISATFEINLRTKSYVESQ
jgi:hypothetical protein